MPIFKVTISRVYREAEGFDRYVEADTVEDAIALGNRLGTLCDNDVPDDCKILADSYDNQDAYFEADLCEEVHGGRDPGADIWAETAIAELED